MVAGVGLVAMSSTARRDRIRAEYDGEEVEIANSVRVTERQEHHVVAAREHESFEASESPRIVVDEVEGKPEYVTEELAQYLWDHFSINVKDEDIEVVDIDSNEVTVL